MVEDLSRFNIYRVSALEECSCKGSVIEQTCAGKKGFFKGFHRIESRGVVRLSIKATTSQISRCLSYNGQRIWGVFYKRGFTGLRAQGTIKDSQSIPIIAN